jgi:hypothetical protein
MKTGILLLVFFASAAQALAQEPFLVRTVEWRVTTKSVAGPYNVGNCMIVYSDGRLHLELRRQEFGYGPASLISYEKQVTTEQLTTLRAILNSDSLRKLQPIHMPDFPLKSHLFGAFTAEIPRAANIQKVNAIFVGSADTRSPEDTIAWKEASIVLQPLMDWSHHAKTDVPKLQIVTNADGLCGK